MNRVGCVQRRTCGTVDEGALSESGSVEYSSASCGGQWILSATNTPSTHTAPLTAAHQLATPANVPARIKVVERSGVSWVWSGQVLTVNSVWRLEWRMEGMQ